MDHASSAACKISSEMVLEGLYKSKLQDSIQLLTVSVLYEQEKVRNHEQPSYSSLNLSVRRCVDQTMRTRNFKEWNEIVERGEATQKADNEESKRRKASAERKADNAISGKQLDNV